MHSRITRSLEINHELLFLLYMSGSPISKLQALPNHGRPRTFETGERTQIFMNRLHHRNIVHEVRGGGGGE